MLNDRSAGRHRSRQRATQRLSWSTSALLGVLGENGREWRRQSGGDVDFVIGTFKKVWAIGGTAPATTEQSHRMPTRVCVRHRRRRPSSPPPARP
jgi:hypothetical protein